MVSLETPSITTMAVTLTGGLGKRRTANGNVCMSALLRLIFLSIAYRTVGGLSEFSRIANCFLARRQIVWMQFKDSLHFCAAHPLSSPPEEDHERSQNAGLVPHGCVGSQLLLHVGKEVEECAMDDGFGSTPRRKNVGAAKG